MSESTVNKAITAVGIFDILRINTESLAQSTRKTYTKAASALATFLNEKGIGIETLTSPLISEWIVSMYASGLSLKSIKLYVDAVASLCNSAAGSCRFLGEIAFKEIKAALQTIVATSNDIRLTKEEFKRLVSIGRSAGNQSGEISLATDIFLTALLTGCMPVKKVITLKNSDIDDSEKEISEIADRHSSARRRYVFPLQQSILSESRIERNVNNLVRRLLALRNLTWFGTTDETVRTYWAYTALMCGKSGSEIISTLGKAPAGLPILSLCDSFDISSETREKTRREIGEALTDNPLRWYAMRLRPHATYAELDRRLTAIANEIKRPETFYPCEEIARKTGRRVSFRQKPIISDIVFFRSRVTGILPLFRKIGDLAWCYTTAGRTGSTYAAIPQRDFEIFQEAIGQFTPEYEVAPLGTLPLKENDRVIVVGGLFQGHEAILDKITPSPISSLDTLDPQISAAPNLAQTIYQLRISGNNGIEWRICTDARTVKATI